MAITVVQGSPGRIGTAVHPAELSPFVLGTLDAVNLLSRMVDEKPVWIRPGLIVSDKTDDALLLLAAARDRLRSSLPRYFNPSPRIDSEQMAMSIIRSTAEQLAQAGQALDYAAEQLREAGKGLPANRVKQAANAAHEASQGLVGPS